MLAEMLISTSHNTIVFFRAQFLLQYSQIDIGLAATTLPRWQFLAV